MVVPTGMTTLKVVCEHHDSKEIKQLQEQLGKTFLHFLK